MGKLRHFAGLLAFFVLMGGCASSPFYVNEWEEKGYHFTVNEIDEHNLISFEWEVIVNGPPWRAWNLMLDIENSITMSPGIELIKGPIVRDDGSIINIVEFNPRWYAPSVTTVLRGSLLPDKLGWEDECIGGYTTDCYMQFHITPYGDGSQSVIRVAGYMERPWFAPFWMLIHPMQEGAEGFALRANLLIQRSKYGNRDLTYPWEDLNKLAQAAPRDSVRKATQSDEDRPRLAIERLHTFGQSETDSVLATVAGDYLAYAVLTLGRYEVTTPEDLELMSRYLGKNWSLLCSDEACKERIAKAAEADFLLSGKLRRNDGNYHLNLVLLDSKTGSSVWRMQKTVTASIDAVKSALDDAANDLRTVRIN